MPNRPPAHRPSTHRERDNRPSAAARGYGRRWQVESKRFLDSNPLCVRCLADGVTNGGEDDRDIVVDHVVPHRGDERLFWDRGNWQTLCKRHHDLKTVREDGGLGRAPTGDATR